MKKMILQRFWRKGAGLIALLLMLVPAVFAQQIFDPVKWSYSAEMTGKDEVVLKLKATIDEGWHLYSQEKAEGDITPIPTSFNFEESNEYELIGETEEGKPIEKYDPQYEMTLKYFEEKAEFTQKIKVNSAEKFTVKGGREFMVCNDERCLPPDYAEFEITVDPSSFKGGSGGGGSGNGGKIEEEKEQTPQNKQEGKNTGNNLIGAGDGQTQAAAPGQSGILDPVKWTFDAEKINENEYWVTFTARMEKGWHLYSQDIPEGGPIATSFNFEDINGYELIGNVDEPKAEEEYDPNFEMTLKYHSTEVTFKQKIKLEGKGARVKGYLEYMVCDSIRCLPPETIEFSVKAGKTSIVQPEEQRSLIGIFIGGFLGGLLALLTPCVFPMIPLTVSFFTKQSKDRSKGIFNAVVYGLSIIVIYVALGTLITIIFGPDALNALASNAYMNMAFFIIFLIFAISFLGAFEITLPSSWVNKADSASDKGGLIGIFFMAFTLSLVSFSCTGPIIGTLLVQAAVVGSRLGPAIGMLGFSLALALPFALFAAFPGWLNSLPKSGGWLNTVKVVLGILELALALKFLSIVDLAYHWGILTREVFIALWIVLFSTLGFYLLGKLRFPNDAEVKQISIPRYFFAVITFAFVVYLIPGMWGAPLKMISGFPPPMFYNEGWSVNQSAATGLSEKKDPVEGIDRSHCPHNLSCFHDYELALEYAKKQDKPLMVDFTGWSCVNCRKMEDQVWIDPRVMDRLENDYVLVSLYVDDKKKLPESKQYVSETTGKKIRTVGNKWSDFQTREFGTNSQPYYVLLDHDEEMLVEPTAYNPDIEEYIEWLDSGLEEFAERD